MKPLSFIEIDGDALRSNYKALAKWCPHCKPFAVVKSNAYGHGMAEVVGELDGLASGFAVDDVEELALCRRLTKAPIIVLGYVQSADIAKATGLNGELVVYDTARLPEIANAAKHLGTRVRVHLKIDAL
jgi:alanine racemase